MYPVGYAREQLYQLVSKIDRMLETQQEPEERSWKRH